MAAENTSKSMRDPGSFRDPSGYVFRYEGRVFRAVSRDTHAVLREFAQTGLLDALVKDGLLISSTFVEDAALTSALAAQNPGYEHFIEHKEIQPWSYPYEWSFSMLASAAQATLEIQRRLVVKGFSLKDASAYNVQFVKGKPVFIDLTSICRPSRLDIWYALGQFQRHFVYPLMLCSSKGWDLRSYFLANIDGIPVSQVAKNFSGLSKLNPANLLDVVLPNMFEKRDGGKKSPSATTDDSKSKDPSAQILNLKRLKGKIASLVSGFKIEGTWHDYTSTCTYDRDAEQVKKGLITDFLKRMSPSLVMDIGCNSGDYSYIAARSGAAVIAMDADHGPIELLFRRLAKEPFSITPLIVDISNPSPSVGFLNAERPGFLQRMSSDCVFALALIHHLLVSANLGFGQINDLFSRLTSKFLVLEFVPLEDEQFQRLIRFRDESFEYVNLETCRRAMQESFEIIEEHPVTGTVRTLMFLRKRA